MLESIPWQIAGSLTPPVLLGLTVWLILTGRLIPYKMYQERKDSEEHWRKLAEDLKDTNHLTAQTALKQSVVGDTVIKVMDALPKPRDGGDDG